MGDETKNNGEEENLKGVSREGGGGGGASGPQPPETAGQWCTAKCYIN